MDNNVSKFMKNKSKPKKNIFISILSKLLICFILVIGCLILMKRNPSFKTFMEDKVFKDNLSFAYLNNLYNKYLGNILPSYKTEDTEEVFNEKLEYKNYSIYHDGYKLEVSDKYLVPIIESGIVVFTGEMDNYGNSVIIEGIDGVDIWYGNLDNVSVKMYDYVMKGNFLGEAKDSNLYLVFEKNQEYLKFEDYIKN